MSEKPKGADVREYIESGMLEISPINYVRGRSLNKVFMIIDEAQNLTPKEIKTLITRAGRNTKVVLTGDPEQIDNSRIVRALLLQAHAHLFGVIFWFIILGMTGALLYALTGVMHQRYRDIHGGYSRAVADLRSILMWPSARLLALGFALSGSLEDALNGWRSVQGAALECSEEIIAASGLGAMQFRPEQDEEQNFSNQIYALQAMINRTLIISLTQIQQKIKVRTQSIFNLIFYFYFIESWNQHMISHGSFYLFS